MRGEVIGWILFKRMWAPGRRAKETCGSAGRGHGDGWSVFLLRVREDGMGRMLVGCV